MHRALTSFAIVLMLSFGVALAASGSDSSRPAPHAPPPTAPMAERGAPAPDPDLVFLAAAQLVQARLTAIIGWADAVNANTIRTAAYVGELTEMRERSRSATSVVEIQQPMLQSTGACGGATNGADRYIGRESGGDPAVFNGGGSGAYGCYQIMPGTWASSCSDLGGEVGSSASTQATCASRLPLSAWAG